MSHDFPDPLVDVSHLCFQYPSSSAGALLDVSLSVNRGDRVLVIGHNGSGKSTLLSVIAGRRRAAEGSVVVLGTDAFNNTGLQHSVALIGTPWPPESFFACTVEQIASPAPLPQRRETMAALLHLDLQRSVSDMSTGERRRVQILHGMLRESAVYLLDECSTDIDVAERRTVLELIKAECVAQGSCCLYATHIIDGTSDWATHVALMRNGCLVDFRRMTDINEPLEDFAFRFLTDGTVKSLGSCYKEKSVKDKSPNEAQTALSSVQSANKDDNVIVCNGLNYKDIFCNLSFTIRRGERVLLCGCNGAGKSTLLNMMGGKQFFNNRDGALRILGRACYDNMSLNALIAFGGDWWTSVPPGEVYVGEIIQIHTDRARQLRDLLNVDLSWDVRHISAGEQKRVQILLYLLEEKPVVLLDEATSDLDLNQRHALLDFLYDESVRRGVTVVYATHIFGGLDGWPSAAMIMDRKTRGLHAFWRDEEVSITRVTDAVMTLKNNE